MTDSATFDRRFLAAFAVLLTVAGMAFIYLIVFYPVPKENQQNASMALGFVLGTLLASPIGFFFGSSKSQATTLSVPAPAPALLKVTS